MLLSQLSAEQRSRVLEEPKNYPLRVSFLGKVGLLTAEEVSFLLANGVDIDVDNWQLAAILPNALIPGTEEPLIPGVGATRLPTRYLAPLAALVIGAWVLLRRVLHISSGGGGRG